MTEKPENTAPHVYSAIVSVMGDLAKEGIGKNRKNDQQGYKFRGIDDVYNALALILAKHNLTIIPRVLTRQKETLTNSKGNPLFYVTVECEFDITSALDGSTVSVRTFGEAMDSADKATNKAMSAAYKYMALQTFCIPTEGDNDADDTTHTPAAPRAAPAPQPKQSLADRYSAFATRLKAANTPQALERVWSLGSALIAELEKADPDLAEDLRTIHAERVEALSGREAA